ncbi:RluA family pseudouridine synthase [Neolewinella persica]|uniref:RluA family pseudouridine synthase n=1 Tax=Neolewinella persica TaxID=70998 RepID=UPI00036C2808|nr:RluA family pseudouridine synthase [Neolewinella persica]
MKLPLTSFIHDLPPEVLNTQLPERFTFPFHYVPHPVAVAAVADLQRHLETQSDWVHDFGHGETAGVGAKGKMFGVLVVRKNNGSLGYLAAYSGKLADSNHLPGFVPPVYDVLLAEGFYKQGEKEVNAINARIEALENAPELAAARDQLARAQVQAKDELAKEKASVKAAKKARKLRREAARETMSPEAVEALEKELVRMSVGRHFGYKDLVRAWDARLQTATENLEELTGEINRLKDLRKTMSNDLQRRIFEEYRFLDADGTERDLTDIFKDTIFKTPPAGAGECAAPKLLQFAYLHGLRPVVMAEFWWGQSPRSEIRKHGHFYPACRGKCEPILGHMLVGLPVDPNPMLDNPALGKVLPTIYEDDQLLVVNKPAEFLSVPGKNIEDSVWLRIKKKYPDATGPLIVHRLDMSTSGLLLLTKTKDTHKLLQHQFFKRSVQKRYVALLEGVVKGEEGTIDLPLRGDIEDRPRQIVCHEHGKTSRTHWKVIGREEGRTRVHFWPVTGRTHQLRVHAAHPHGLNAPIVGDDLYGQPAERLHLHAEWISFVHPDTREEVVFEAPAEF